MSAQCTSERLTVPGAGLNSSHKQSEGEITNETLQVLRALKCKKKTSQKFQRRSNRRAENSEYIVESLELPHISEKENVPKVAHHLLGTKTIQAFEKMTSTQIWNLFKFDWMELSLSRISKIHENYFKKTKSYIFFNCEYISYSNYFIMYKWYKNKFKAEKNPARNLFVLLEWRLGTFSTYLVHVLSSLVQNISLKWQPWLRAES